MRAEIDQPTVSVEPGSTTDVVVDIVNTGDVIDGISANVIGLANEFVRTTPELLPLFPTSAGQLTVSLAVPPTHPAGRHQLTVELFSHSAHQPAQYVDVDLDVAAHPSLQILPKPRLVQARRNGRFVIELTNDGNVPLDVKLEAADSDRAMSARFTPAVARVEPGAAVPVLLQVRGPRMITGAPTERPLKVLAIAKRADLREDAAPGSDEGDEPKTTTVRLKQRPMISRGLMTALILMSIVALWASVFLLGLTKVFSNDPMTKAAPASFFTSTKASAQGAAGGKAGGSGAPAGALPKSGQVQAGVGGEISGTVTAASNHAAVGRILVRAYRQGRSGLVPVSSAATQTDGTFTLAGLFPTDYLIKFSGTNSPGTKFVTQWWPHAPSPKGARPVAVSAEGSTTGIDVTMKGAPATITGTVDPGNAITSVKTVVKVYSLSSTGTTQQFGKAVTAGSKNQYTLAGLPAPNQYELTFTTKGYQSSSIVDTVAAGDQRIEPAVDLDAATGTISGVVRAGGAAVGGATISTTVNGQAVTSITPTTGSIGQFSLTNLPTPATYVLTISDPTHGSTTDIVDLKAGQTDKTVTERLTGGGGGVAGKVYGVGADKKGLGGATVTVGGTLGDSGAGTTGTTTGTTGDTTGEPSTTTITSPGGKGDFAINGLPAGTYTLTVAADGYLTASIQVKVSANTAAKPYPIHLVKVDGAIAGVVQLRAARGGTKSAAIGATVTATDGINTYSTISTSAGAAGGDGSYVIGSLPPGTYTVTATLDGYQQQTRIAVVVADKRTTGQNLTVTKSAS